MAMMMMAMMMTMMMMAMMMMTMMMMRTMKMSVMKIRSEPNHRGTMVHYTAGYTKTFYYPWSWVNGWRGGGCQAGRDGDGGRYKEERIWREKKDTDREVEEK